MILLPKSVCGTLMTQLILEAIDHLKDLVKTVKKRVKGETISTRKIKRAKEIGRAKRVKKIGKVEKTKKNIVIRSKNEFYQYSVDQLLFINVNL